MVHTQKFGDMQVPVPGFGAMGISFGLGNNLTLEQAEPVLLKALELGCTFWDTAVRRSCMLSIGLTDTDQLGRLSIKPV